MEYHRKECPYCNKEVNEGIAFCPYCGKKQPMVLNKDELDKNPYQILQISEDAGQDAIKTAYRSLARKYHPDRDTASVSEEKMREINWAHGILSDPNKLAEWKLKHQEKQAPESSGTGQASPNKKNTASNERQPPFDSYRPPPKSTANVSKNPSSRSFSSIWKLVVIGVVILIVMCAIIYGYLNQTNYQSSTVTPTSTLTPTRIPTNTFIPVHNSTRTPTSILSSCILWSTLTKYDVGNSRCIYGRVVKIYGTDQYRQIIRFSNDAGTFLIWDRNDFFEVSVGNCIAAIGNIHQDASELYMNISGTNFYEYRGCP